MEVLCNQIYNILQNNFEIVIYSKEQFIREFKIIFELYLDYLLKNFENIYFLDNIVIDDNLRLGILDKLVRMSTNYETSNLYKTDIRKAVENYSNCFINIAELFDEFFYNFYHKFILNKISNDKKRKNGYNYSCDIIDNKCKKIKDDY